MIISEDEAKTKWCPLARVPVPGVGAVNRAVDRITRDAAGKVVDAEVDLSLSRCLGSECMAWQWIGWRDANEKFRDVITSYPPPQEHAAQWVHVGSCGLARASS